LNNGGAVAAAAVPKGKTAGVLRVWDSPTDARGLVLKGHQYNVATIRAGAKRFTVLSLGPERFSDAEGMPHWGTAVVSWDLQKGAERSRSVLPGNYCLDVSPLGERVLMSDHSGDPAVPDKAKRAADGKRSASLYDTTSGDKLAVLQADGLPLEAARFSADGNTVAVLAGQSRVILWRDKGKSKALTVDAPEKVGRFALSADAKTLFTYEGVGFQTRLRQWDLSTRKGVRTYPISGAKVLETSPDGKTFVVSNGGQIALYDPTTGQLLARWPADVGGVTALSYSPDSALLAAGGMQGTVRLWRLPGN
jgi:WD40 repeat protein